MGDQNLEISERIREFTTFFLTKWGRKSVTSVANRNLEGDCGALVRRARVSGEVQGKNGLCEPWPKWPKRPKL